MKVEIDRTKCLGNGNCVLVAPQVFDQDDDGLAILLIEDLSPGQAALAIDAVKQCPVNAINLV